MRLLVSWVRDFVDVKASAEEIADKLGVRGFEVASVEPAGIIDFEVTANRPDCLSVLGFAREIAAVYDLPVRLPSAAPGSRIELAHVPAGQSDRVSVTIEDAERCPRYAAAVAEIAAATTPRWMLERLTASGVRPISVIVDITNYVLMELGHPMHAFDAARLEGSAIRVRGARPGETITTLDGIERKLDEEMLVIADAARPQAVAGVMGGADSEVSAATRSVVFESAYFKPASVRRTSKRLGLKTEASARFERGADISAPVVALQRALGLMQQIGAGRVHGPLVDRYPSPRGPLALHLRRGRLALVLGLTIPDSEVERILRALGLSVTPDRGNTGWDVSVPTFRVDLLCEVDLIEEVGRHYGIDRVDAAFPPMTAAAAAPERSSVREETTRRLLTSAGLSEALTFAFIEAKAAQPFVADAAPLVRIANPLSGKFEVLRPSLLPGLIDAVAHNRRHGRRDVALFEIGRRFNERDGESRALGIAWTGAVDEHWSSPARAVDFYDVKGVVESLCGSLSVAPVVEPAAVTFLVPGQAASILIGGSPVGVIGLASAAIVDSRGAPKQDKVFVAELDLDRLWSLADAARNGASDIVTAQPLPRYPFVVRDLSIVVSESLPAEIIRGTIQRTGESGRAPLTGVTFFDRYKGAGLEEGAVSLSVRLTFQAADRTLTDADVQDSFDRILTALVAEHHAVQR